MDRPLDAPRALSLPDGASFTVPAGWVVQPCADGALLRRPEGGFAVAVVQARDSDPDVAVAAAWRRLGADGERAPDSVVACSARSGFRDCRQYGYDTSSNERIVLFARAQRQAATWTVVVARAKSEMMERRAAEFQLVLASLRARAWRDESFAGRRVRRLDARRLARLLAFVDGARRRAGVPGVALALVQDGVLIFEGGLGERALGSGVAVGADTRFLIASNTKPLSTLLLARLVDERRLGWDMLAKDALAGLRLGSQATTDRVQIRHLVGASTGMPRRDLDWLFRFDERTPADQLRLLATMEPTTGFGEVFQYNNLLAAAAGYIAGHATAPSQELGAAYDRAMQTRVFAPLGMRSATFDFAEALRGDHATPHAWDVEGRMAIAAMSLNRAIIPVRPAGGAWASVRDLRRYVAMELDGGRLADGTRWVSEASLLERRRPQVAVGEHEAYGMGLQIGTRCDAPLIHHGGCLFGFTGDLFWLPEHRVGGVILTNASEGWLLLAPFIRRTLELLFDGDAEAEDDFTRSLEAARVQARQQRSHLALPPDAAAVRALAHRYVCDELGALTVRDGGGDVVFAFAGWSSPVASRANGDGTISFVTIGPGMAGFELVVATRDRRPALVLRDAQHEYHFIATDGA